MNILQISTIWITISTSTTQKETIMQITKSQLDAQPKFNNSTDDEPYTCACCGKVLNTAKAVWLEGSTVTSKYYLKDVVPAEDSQGYFAFGITCAKKVALTTY
jgi:hypothetical protein